MEGTVYDLGNFLELFLAFIHDSEAHVEAIGVVGSRTAPRDDAVEANGLVIEKNVVEFEVHDGSGTKELSERKTEPTAAHVSEGRDPLVSGGMVPPDRVVEIQSRETPAFVYVRGIFIKIVSHRSNRSVCIAALHGRFYMTFPLCRRFKGPERDHVGT